MLSKEELQKKVGRGETCPCPLLGTSSPPCPHLYISAPPWNIGICKSESCLRKEKKLIGLQREKKLSSDMAGERMEDGQAYFTPVCSDHFVLLSIFVQELCLLWSIKSLLLCCSQTQQGVATWFAGLSWSCGVVQQPVVYFSNWFDLFVNICARNGVFCACFLDLLECCKLEYWVIPLQIFLTYTINISLRKLSSFTQILYILDPWISFTWL